jgi:hypothetical protein
MKAHEEGYICRFINHEHTQTHKKGLNGRQLAKTKLARLANAGTTEMMGLVSASSNLF